MKMNKMIIFLILMVFSSMNYASETMSFEVAAKLMDKLALDVNLEQEKPSIPSGSQRDDSHIQRNDYKCVVVRFTAVY